MQGPTIFVLFSEGREMKMVGDTKLVLLVPSCVDGWTATGGLVAPAPCGR